MINIYKRYKWVEDFITLMPKTPLFIIIFTVAGVTFRRAEDTSEPGD